MITRRTALQQIALTTGAFALGSAVKAQQPAPPPAEADGVFKVPPLGYNYDALEPFIDAETMKIHHDKHHAAYVSKLNQAITKAPGSEKKTIEEILAGLESLPEEIRAEVRNQGGGHANHSLLWETLKKNDGGAPEGDLAKAMEGAFGAFDQFQTQFSEAAGKVFGSGWAWLTWRDGKLVVETTANQDSPLITGGTPLLGIDVWEHAYYLKYQNRRAEYVKGFFNVINWPFVAARFAAIPKA